MARTSGGCGWIRVSLHDHWEPLIFIECLVGNLVALSLQGGGLDLVNASVGPLSCNFFLCSVIFLLLYLSMLDAGLYSRRFPPYSLLGSHLKHRDHVLSNTLNPGVWSSRFDQDSQGRLSDSFPNAYPHQKASQWTTKNGNCKSWQRNAVPRRRTPKKRKLFLPTTLRLPFSKHLRKTKPLHSLTFS